MFLNKKAKKKNKKKTIELLILVFISGWKFFKFYCAFIKNTINGIYNWSQ